MFEIDITYTFEMLNGLIFAGIVFSMFFFIVFEATKKLLDRIIPR